MSVPFRSCRSLLIASSFLLPISRMSLSGSFGCLGQNKKSTQRTHSNPKTHPRHILAPRATSFILIRRNDCSTSGGAPAGSITHLRGRGRSWSVTSWANKEALVIIGLWQGVEVDWTKRWRREALLIDCGYKFTFNSSDRGRGRR